MEGSFDIIIKNGEVVLPDEVRRMDIGIAAGRIAALADHLDAQDTRVLEAAGCYVLPGMIDMHVHFNEPNMGYWEGFRTGSAALAAGGCTTYADMPLNGIPPTVNVEALRLKADAARLNSAVDYTFWGGLVPGNLTHLEAMADAGVIGFKAFLSNPGGEGEERFREVDDWTLHEGMKRIAAFNGILALHAESDAITSRLAADAISQGRTGALDFAASRPAIAEQEAVNRALFFAGKTGCRLHFVHISSPETIEIIAQAKKSGFDVTAETCPHYLLLNETDMERIGAAAKCAPPLRSESEREGLWEKLAEGKIDLIASDHSPCPGALKQGEGKSFFDVWGGISGAQSSLELLFHEGVNRRKLPVTLLSRMLSGQPAARFGLSNRKGSMSLGMDADIAILDPDWRYMLRKEDLYYRHQHSPYIGMQLSCKVKTTLCRGQIVYTAEEGIRDASGGCWMKVVKGVPING
ncbi:allantoinase [Paenibacillus abyssi]|uniref:Allantoinase n=1 Tax=Paenibacillus abyssi TaxID=1340531 RepID=A0A917CVL3_9BACL|nr:allantoinase [Paenibacillus abyssi]GGF99750.1 allantoinase [Paenibacillus abyssi]